MKKKKKKNKLFIFLIICFVLVPFLLTKGCNYMESFNQAKNSVSEPITSISEQIKPSASVYTHAQAHSIRKANLTGTAVPDSGYVEKVYFNTNLTTDVVNEILSTIIFYPNLIPNSSASVYPVLMSGSDPDNSYGILILKVPQPGGISTYRIDVASDSVSQIIYRSWEGWVSIEEISFNINNVLGQLSSAYGITIQNYKLSSLISITPFEQSSSNELSIGNLFTQLGNAIIIFGSAVVNVFISMEPIFWNEGPTLIFILLIASVSFALVFWGIELLISLIGVFKAKRKKKK